MKLLKTFALAEGTKSNDSWCVGEVDPGKRLVFRKSLSCKYPEPWCGVWCTYIHTYILASCLRNLHALVYSASGAVCPVPGSWSSVAEPCVLRSSGLPRRARQVDPWPGMGCGRVCWLLLPGLEGVIANTEAAPWHAVIRVTSTCHRVLPATLNSYGLNQLMTCLGLSCRMPHRTNIRCFVSPWGEKADRQQGITV